MVPHPGIIPDVLDADAVLAGQAALAGQPSHTVAVATTNVAHLTRSPGVDAETWYQIRSIVRRGRMSRLMGQNGA